MKPERCTSCGGFDFVDATDNHGKPYRGCARCVIVPPWLCGWCQQPLYRIPPFTGQQACGFALKGHRP